MSVITFHTRVIACTFGFAIALLAVSVGAEEIFPPANTDLFITKTSLGTFTCARPGVTSGWAVGYWKASTNIFTSAREMLRLKRQKLKAATPAQQTKLLKAITKTKSYMKNGASVCKAGPEGNPLPPVGATPTTPPSSQPTNTPRPMPTSTPRPMPGTCPANGDSARGRTFFILNCQGCHPNPAEYRGTSCSKLASAYQRPDMRNIPHTPQNDSDIVVYLGSL